MKGTDRGEWREREEEERKKKYIHTKSVSGVSLYGFLTHPNKSVEEEGASSGGTVGSSWH